MIKLFLLAGAAALVAAAPVAAKPKHGEGMRTHDSNRNGVPDYRERARADLNGNGILDYRERRLVDVNRNGVADWRERWIDRNRNGVDDRREGYRYSTNRYGSPNYGVNDCPPGLAKKNNGCLPPGQAKRQFAQGQRIPYGYRYYTPYGDLPSQYYDDYDLDDDYRYIHRDNYLYEVDPATSLVRRVISLIL